MKSSILIYRTGHLGDTVCAIPAFRLIRNQFPQSSLSLLCDRPLGGKVAAAEVISALGIFDQVLSYASGQKLKSIWQMVKLIRMVRPDIAILLPQVRESEINVHRKIQLFKLCGVPTVLGLQLPFSDNDWHPNEADRLVQILNALGITGNKPAYEIPVDLASRLTVDQKLHEIGLDPEQPFILFCGGGKSATQRWPLDRYATVLKQIAAQTSWAVLGLGNQQEIQLYQSEILPVFDSLRLLKHSLSLPEMFELCRRAAIYLGNDTGPMHVAAAVNCPVVVVMSARNAPGMWDPDATPNLVIRHRTNCENCFLNDCIQEQHRCMTAITVESVIEQTLQFINSVPVKGDDVNYVRDRRNSQSDIKFA